MHEVFPGHYPPLSAPAQRGLEGAPLDAVRAGVVHRRLGALLRADDARGRLRPGRSPRSSSASSAEALVRLARFVVGIRLHTDDWSVEQGVRFFRDEAFLEEASARREAERGTFDPTYLVYSAGKLMLLKLRRDWQEQQGGKTDAARVPRRVPGAGVGAVLGAAPPDARQRRRRRAGVSSYAALRISVRRVRRTASR